MQRAVDIVETSPHPDNKIAATLAAGDFIISRTNYWPAAIEQHFEHDTDIGNSSGTIHAETACLLAAMTAGRATNDGALYITDLPCPNCAKNIAEAGVTALYIDHKGFDKDFALRRGDDFEHMSLRICQKAGISVYKIFRKDARLEVIWEVPEGFEPTLESPARLTLLEREIDAVEFIELAADKDRVYGEAAYSVALGMNADGAQFLISAQSHPVIGYTSHTIESTDSKYSFTQRPLNRVLMIAAREGLKIEDGFVFASITPTARELVNFVGAELSALSIGEAEKSRDAFGPIALGQLTQSKILNVQH